MKLSFTADVLLTVCIFKVFFMFCVSDLIIFHMVFGLNEGMMAMERQHPPLCFGRLWAWGAVSVSAPSVW